MRDVVGHDDRDVALGRLELGHRLEDRDLPLDHGFQVEFEQHRRMRRAPSFWRQRGCSSPTTPISLAVQPDARRSGRDARPDGRPA